MNDAPPRLPEAPPPLASAKGSSRRWGVWLALGLTAAVVFGIATGFVAFRIRGYLNQGTAPARDGGVLEAAHESKDFSRAASVSIVLGEKGSSQGVEHITTERDGLTAVTKVKGQACRYPNLPPRTDGGPRSIGYFYFSIAPTFKQQNAKMVRIEVEYYSENRCALSLQYDASASSKSLQTIYSRTGPAVALDGSKEWETAAFHIRNAAFENAQNGGADFRLEVTPPEVCIRRVTVSRERKEDF